MQPVTVKNRKAFSCFSIIVPESEGFALSEALAKKQGKLFVNLAKTKTIKLATRNNK